MLPDLKPFLMKIKHALLLIALGYCFEIFGALLKILHYLYADPLLVTSAFLKILGIIVLLYKILTHPKAKEYLNW